MSEPRKRRKFTIFDFILILLGILLVWVLYNVLGGDVSILTRLGDLNSENGPLSNITESLAAFGEGIKGAFTGIFR